MMLVIIMMKMMVLMMLMVVSYIPYVGLLSPKFDFPSKSYSISFKSVLLLLSCTKGAVLVVHYKTLSFSLIDSR